MIAAVMSSATLFPGEMLERTIDRGAPSDAQVALVENLLRLVLEADQTKALSQGLTRIAAPVRGEYADWQYCIVAGVIDAIEYRGGSLRAMYEEGSPDLRTAIESAQALFAAAGKDAFDDSLPLKRRVQAVRLVGRGLERHDEDPRSLADLLVPQTPVELQLAAVNVLALLQPDHLCEMFLDQWAELGPEIRPRILDILLDDVDGTLQLLDRIVAGEILANELGAVNRSKLILHSSSKVRSAASKLLNPSSPAERLSAIERYRQLLDNVANAQHGREVFRQHCATCHRLEETGTDIGPDLLALTDRSPETLLVAILDPNRAVEPRFVEYSAVTQAGRVFSGIIAAETGNSITLIDAQGARHGLLRTELDELVSTGRSLMPVGVEELLSDPSELLDLIAYVRSVEGDPPLKKAESSNLGL